MAQCADMLYSGRMGPQRFSEQVAQLVRSKYAAQRAAQLAAAPAESQGGNIEMLTYNIKGMRPWWNVGTQSASAKKGEHCRLRRCCKSRHAARQAHSRENACRHRLFMTPAPCTSYSGHPPEYAPFYAASGLSPENAHYVRDIPVGMRPVLVHEFEGNPAFSRCKHESSCSYGLSCRYKHTEQEVAYFIARATAECLGWGLINAR